jgi:hypothetical protein
VKKTNAKGQEISVMGADLDHFRFVSEYEEVAAAFQEAFGEKPTLLRVYLPYRTAEENFSTWKEAWAASGLVHRCDGQTMVIWRTADGKYSREPQPCDGKCKEVGRLEMVVPELLQAGFVGYVTLETHSQHDLMNITASLRAAEEARGDHPLGLRGIEFTLRRRKERISTPAGDGKRVTREKWLVSIEPSATWVETQYQLSRSGREERLQLPDGRKMDPGTGEVEEEPPEGVEDCDDGGEPEEAEGAEPMAGREAAMTADELVGWLRARSAQYKAQYNSSQPTSGQFTLMVSLLNQIAGGDDSRRITFLREVWQIKESSNELKRRNVEATLDWMAPEEYIENGKEKWRPGNPFAIEEFHRVVNAAIGRRAVGTLPGMEQP